LEETGEYMPELLYLNGEVMPLAEGKVSVEDRGFQFADGVYEVVAVYNTVPYELPEHVERLFQSAAGIELVIPHTPAEVEGVARRLVADSGFRQCIVYVQVTRGHARRKHAFPAEVRPTLLLYVREFTGHPPENYTLGIRTITVPDDRWSRCHIKSIALLANVLAKERAHRAGAYEAIYHSAEGLVYEGSSSNVFCVLGGTVTTPPLCHKLLPGLTRRRLLLLAREAAIPVAEREFTVAELKGAEEVFITGTTSEVMPVCQVDDVIIGRGAPGPVTQRVRGLMLKHISERCGSVPALARQPA
jgi:D-alanine transaminase